MLHLPCRLLSQRKRYDHRSPLCGVRGWYRSPRLVNNVEWVSAGKFQSVNSEQYDHCFPCFTGHHANGATSLAAAQCTQSGAHRNWECQLLSVRPRRAVAEYSTTAGDMCTAAGSFGNTTGLSECQLCPPGEYEPDPGQGAQCRHCDEGPSSWLSNPDTTGAVALLLCCKLTHCQQAPWPQTRGQWSALRALWENRLTAVPAIPVVLRALKALRELWKR